MHPPSWPQDNILVSYLMMANHSIWALCDWECGPMDQSAGARLSALNLSSHPIISPVTGADYLTSHSKPECPYLWNGDTDRTYFTWLSDGKSSECGWVLLVLLITEWQCFWSSMFIRLIQGALKSPRVKVLFQWVGSTELGWSPCVCVCVCVTCLVVSDSFDPIDCSLGLLL